MNKSTIVLADNSYTIRRIVELSFSEEEIELVSLENGLNIKEKLLELKPQVILVDIKLPELNGYEICKFINNSSELSGTQVFLMKGGFEPIDENQLKNLTYVDIITKPFDSNALVTTIKEVLEIDTVAPPKVETERVPPPIPNDIPEIESFGDSSPNVDISFSDVKDEIESNDILETTEEGGESRIADDDDILPSEEITQGSQQEKHDPLSPQAVVDEIDNPFMDKAPAEKDGGQHFISEELQIKENIKIQEQELEIGSLTQEVINIKDQISRQGEEAIIDPPAKDIQKELNQPAEDFSMEKELENYVYDTSNNADPEQPKVEAQPKISEFQSSIEKADAELSEELPDFSDISPEPESQEASVSKEESVESSAVDQPAIIEQQESPDQDSSEPINELPQDQVTEEPAEMTPLDTDIPVDIPDLGETPEEPIIHDTPTLESLKLNESPEKEVESSQENDMEDSDISPDPVTDLSSEDKELIMYKVEDKLGVAVKEILWEIAPPLAEKIIKKEIEKLKSDIEKEYSD